MPLTLVVVGLLPVTILLAEIVGIRVAFLASAPVAASMLGLVAVWAYGVWRGLKVVPEACELVLIYTAVVVISLVYSYVTLRPAFPLADAKLAGLDAMLGFSVRGIVHWADASPVRAWVLEACYNSLGLQLGFLPLAIAVLHSRDRAARMLVAQLAICLIGCTISIGWPAVGAFDFHGLGMEQFKNLSGAVGYQFHEGFARARSDETFMLTSDLISGVSTFPSIHAALAVMCAWAAWPVAWLRWPVLLLNVGMYVSTVPVGAHYGVDVLAGTLLAIAVIDAVRRMRGSLWRHAIAWGGTACGIVPTGKLAYDRSA